MKVIYKYTLEMHLEPQKVKMPNNAEILHINTQGGDVCLWAMVDDDNTQSEREFAIYGTGHPIREQGQGHDYLGTCFMDAFVWHIYEIK